MELKYFQPTLKLHEVNLYPVVTSRSFKFPQGSPKAHSLIVVISEKCHTLSHLRVSENFKISTNGYKLHPPTVVEKKGLHPNLS